MRKIVVITGGGSGMGLEVAKSMNKEKTIILSGRTVAKLELGVSTLKELGFDAYAYACDTSSRDSVKNLVKFAQSKGEISNVINCAGVSPHMCGGEQIIRINALGTLYVNQEFSKVMGKGSVIVDIASNSAYMLPKFMIPKKIFALAETDENIFVTKLIKKTKMAKGDYQRAGFAYSLSKAFTVWYAKKCAIDYGIKGIRVCSVSPGLIETDMGNLEKEEGGFLINLTCEKRMGKAEELGFAIATIADERNGYLAGVDVLIDGGSTTHSKEFKS